MLRAAKIAKRNGRPVVLDPVAAGASTLRRKMCSRLLSENLVSVIRGNASEVRALAAGAEQETGVEASALDSVTEDNLQESAAWLRSFSRRTGAVVMLTGAMDVITAEFGVPAVRGGYWNCFCCGRSRNSAQCYSNLKESIYASCADDSRAAVGHIRSVSYGSSPGIFGKYSEFIRRCFGISEHSCCLPCLFLLPDLLQCKDSSGGKGTGCAIRQGIRRL